MVSAVAGAVDDTRSSLVQPNFAVPAAASMPGTLLGVNYRDALPFDMMNYDPKKEPAAGACGVVPRSFLIGILCMQPSGRG